MSIHNWRRFFGYLGSCPDLEAVIEHLLVSARTQATFLVNADVTHTSGLHDTVGTLAQHTLQQRWLCEGAEACQAHWFIDGIVVILHCKKIPEELIMITCSQLPGLFLLTVGSFLINHCIKFVVAYNRHYIVQIFSAKPWVNLDHNKGQKAEQAQHFGEFERHSGWDWNWNTCELCELRML